jgi:hypothetical protein
MPTVSLSLNSSIEKIISYAGIKCNIYGKRNPTHSMVILDDPMIGKYSTLAHGLKNDVHRIMKHKVFILELLFLIYDLYDILEEEAFERGLRTGKKETKCVQKFKAKKMKIIFYVSFLIWVGEKVLSQI